MKIMLVVLSLILINLGGCYYRGHDNGYRKDRDHHEENKGQDDNKTNHRD